MARPVLAVLSYLPAFQLVSQRLSIKRAAEELHLTPSAVSQQIKALEDALGLKLFRRMTRALALTPAGEQFAALVSDTLANYQQAAERILARHARPVLRVTTDPFVAHEILIPALHTFPRGKRSPELRIETSTGLADLDREELDAAIRFGVGPWPGLTGVVLCDVTATAVCAPRLLERGRIATPAEFARHTLIRLRDQPDPWQRLEQFFSIKLPAERLVFDSYFAMSRAAEEGLGIAVGLFPTTTSAVTEGRLITPFPFRVRLRAKFHFLCRRHDAARPDVLAVRSWAEARFAALRALPQTRAVTTVDEP